MKKKILSILLCTAMVATMAVGCGSSSEEESTEDTATEETTEEEDTADDAAEAETEFTKALAQVDEDLAPLPEKDTGKKLAAIESTLSNSFWCPVLLTRMVACCSALRRQERTWSVRRMDKRSSVQRECVFLQRQSRLVILSGGIISVN